jgi:predicted nucleotidyltransferase
MWMYSLNLKLAMCLFFFRLSDLEKELSSLFDGRKVDLLTPEDLSRHFRIELVAKAEVPYAQD